jgi:uncharacterized membrane protein YkoI
MGIAMKTVLLVVALVALLVAPGYADDDHERARALRERGEVLPLARVIGQLQQQRPGRVLEVELEQKHGRWVYEIELLSEDGAVWEYKLDAASGELLKQGREN